MTKTNPTAAEFAALLSEFTEAARSEDEAAAERCRQANRAILAARPTEPGAMVAQLRFIAEALDIEGDPRMGDALRHIADQLEEMVEPPPA